VINKIEFTAKILTSNAGLFLLLGHTNKNGIFDLIDHDLVFENASINKIKMNHIKTKLCANFIGIDKLERYRKDFRKILYAQFYLYYNLILVITIQYCIKVPPTTTLRTVSLIHAP